MHPFKLSNTNISTESNVGNFVSSRFTVYMGEHATTHFIKIMESFSSDTNKVMNPLEHYSVTAQFHELRHFHDFLSSPSLSHLMLLTVNKWRTVRTINTIFQNDKSAIKPPVLLNVDKLLMKIGFDNACVIREIDAVDNYFFKYHMAKKSVVDTYQNNDLVTVRLDPLPTLPSLIKNGLVVPIDLVSILEGSAVLSQLTFLSSSSGAESTYKVWKAIEATSSKKGSYEYIGSLWLIQSVFGSDSIADYNSLRAFRYLFRFALKGLLVDLTEPPDDRLDNALPFNRFCFLLKFIDENSLQKSFLDNPEEIVSSFVTEYEELLGKVDSINHAYELARLLQSQEFLSHKEDIGTLEFDILSHILHYILVGMSVDPTQVDNELDVLWADNCEPDTGVELIQPPITLYKLKGRDSLTMEVLGDEEGFLWLAMYIMDHLSNNFLYSDIIFCPLSGIQAGCDIAAKNNKININECSGSCTVLEIANYMKII